MKKLKIIGVMLVASLVSSCGLFHPCHCPHFSSVKGVVVEPATKV